MSNLSIDMGIDIFKKNIANVIRESQLPVGIVYYVFKDILTEVQEVYNDTIQKETQQLAEQLEKEKREKEDVKEHQE